VGRGRQERREARRAKGSAIVRRVLYIADITALRTFDATVQARRRHCAPGCTFANDVTADPMARCTLSDFGVEFDEKGNPTPTKSDAVYVVEKGQAKILAKGEDFGQPNGLVWSRARLWVAPSEQARSTRSTSPAKKPTRRSF